MIIPTMKYKEMYDHLAGDHEKVEYRKKYYLPKAIKEFRKTRSFPAWQLWEYTVPETKNKYVIYYYADSYNCIENPITGSFAEMRDGDERFIIKWLAGGYKHTPNSPINLVRQIHAYGSHFFVRYKERILNNMNYSSNEVACIYFSCNDKVMPIEVNEEVNKNIEKYGEGGKVGFIVRDGICFTQNRLEGKFESEERSDNDIVDAILIQFKTFVSNKMLYENQSFAINKEYWNSLLKAYASFEAEATDGELVLKLEP